MKIQPVKGTRDFYPPLMAIRNFIVDGWKVASRRNGFEEYDGPIFEYLQMYQIKSGDEIVEQLFHLTDRGGRELAIRPEITPTLARMVNEQINALPRPIKWFSTPRLCRAERPQKGRLREFFQWNIDIIGIDDCRSDAEVIFTAIDYLRGTGLKPVDIAAKISSRRLLAALLAAVGIESGRLPALYAVLDKKAKLSAEAFEEMLAREVSDPDALRKIRSIMAARSLEEFGKMFPSTPEVQTSLEELKALFALLAAMGIGEYCRFDISIVRGLAYYTGMVFEIHDITGGLRAICGGGRFDNLLRDLGGPEIPAVGMGMGDCVLEILLREKGLLPEPFTTRRLDYFVIPLDAAYEQTAIQIVARLRLAGRNADFSYKTAGLAKQLKIASASNVHTCIILGEELPRDNRLILKDLTTGRQSAVAPDDFWKTIESA